MKFAGFRYVFLSMALLLGLTSGTSLAWAAPAATTTTLAVTSVGSAVTTVASGAVVTLTATVKSGATAVKVGQVNFCDASATYCTDIHLLGTSQLNSAGTAALKFRPGIGSHSYYAVFTGTPRGAIANEASTSSSSALAVTGKIPSAAAIAQSGSPGNYTLTATVGVLEPKVGEPTLTGTVSFLDTSFSNAVLATVPLVIGSSAPSFLTSLPPAASDPLGSVAVAIGDFNGDGIPDLAVGDYDTITILLGNGDGSFTEAANNPTTLANPVDSIAVGDFNRDGRTDLAITGSNYNGVLTILLGNGDGTFTEAPGSPIAIGDPSEITEGSAVADFNGDGYPDIAVANDVNGPGSVTILLGAGDGTFTQATDSPFTVGGGPLSVAVGDFNGDGIPDFVTANFDGTVSIMLGSGDGSFTSAAGSPVTVGSFPYTASIGDFNHDGKADLAVANSAYTSGSPGTVSILLGNGDGTFTAAQGSPVTVGRTPESASIGDFNGDGIADLAVANNGDDTVTVLLGNGDGSFTQAVSSPVRVGDFPQTIVAADFAGSGVSDLAVENYGVTNVFPVFETATATATGIAPAGTGTHLVAGSYSGNDNYASSFTPAASLAAGLPAPVISPASGSFGAPQKVTITEAIPGASIYYSAYGSAATAGWVPYTGPITISGEGFESIDAYATETGYQQSANATVTYDLILPPTAAPVLSLAAGSYPGTQTVTIADANPGAVIYYTTNGVTPTASSAEYTGAISVSSSETLTAAAIAYGYSMSSPVSAQYLIESSSTPFIYTIAGNGSAGFSGNGGPATVADLFAPEGSVLDAEGNLYIADSGNNMVRRVAAGTGIISTIAGTGIPGNSGDNGPATSAQLNYPASLAFDSQGNLYIADANNSVVRKVTKATGVITRFAGIGIFGSGGDNGAATNAYLSNPLGIAVDSASNVYIGDSYNNRIRKVTASTGIITTFAGNGTYGYSGDGSAATAAMLGNPAGLALDGAGNLYIADVSNNRIREVKASTGVITTVAGNGYGASSSSEGEVQGGYSGDGGPAISAEFYSPSGVAVDSAGNLYIADTYNQVIRKVTASTQIVTTYAGDGPAPQCSWSAGDGGPAASASLCYTYGVSVDGSGNVYVPTLNRIRKVTTAIEPPATPAAAPVFSVAAGTYATPQTVTLTAATPGSAIYVTLDGSTVSAASQGYNGPIEISGSVTIQAIAVAPGHLASAPVTAAYTITSAPSAVITTVAGDGIYGDDGATVTPPGLGGPATSAEIGYPEGVALDAAGDLFFSDDFNPVVWEVSATTGIISIVAGNGTVGYSGDGGLATEAQLFQPEGVAVDSVGNLYIADAAAGLVRKVTVSTGIITTIAGVYGQYGYFGHMGDGGPATAADLASPKGLTFDGAGDLYIADSEHGVVRKITASTGIVTTVAGNGMLSTQGVDGPATSVALFLPNSVAVNSNGDLYIADEFVGRVRKVSASTGIMSTVAGNGDIGSSGDGEPATRAEVFPQGIAIDRLGNLYISSGTSVREVAASTGVISTVAGNGYSGYSGDGGAATVAEMNYPRGIAFNKAGSLYIADQNNFRIRKVTFSGPATLATMALPKPGSTIAGGSVTFAWEAGSGVTAYQLWLGTNGVGSSGLYNSGATTDTSVTVLNVPADGTILYARLFSEIDGRWQSIDYTYTESGTPAVLLTPKAGSTLAGTSVAFTWTAGLGVTNYQLWLGVNGAGSSGLYNSGSITAKSATVTGIPAYGATVYVRLYSEIAGVWQHSDYTYTEPGTPAVLTSPKSSSTLSGSDVTFTWSAGEGVTHYELWLGTNGVGSTSLYDSGSVTTTSVTVTTLPAKGATIYARLYSETGGAWVYTDYTFEEAGTPAVLTSPTPGSTLGTSGVTFTWTAGTGNTNYQLWLGANGAGSSGLYDSGSITATSATVATLPSAGATIYARLYSESGGVWQYRDYTFIER